MSTARNRSAQAGPVLSVDFDPAGGESSSGFLLPSSVGIGASSSVTLSGSDPQVVSFYRQSYTTLRAKFGSDEAARRLHQELLRGKLAGDAAQLVERVVLQEEGVEKGIGVLERAGIITPQPIDSPGAKAGRELVGKKLYLDLTRAARSAGESILAAILPGSARNGSTPMPSPTSGSGQIGVIPAPAPAVKSPDPVPLQPEAIIVKAPAEVPQFTQLSTDEREVIDRIKAESASKEPTDMTPPWIQEVKDKASQIASGGAAIIASELAKTTAGRAYNAIKDVVDPKESGPRVQSVEESTQMNVIYLVAGGLLIYWLIKKG